MLELPPSTVRTLRTICNFRVRARACRRWPFGYEEVGPALAVCVSEEGDLGAQARLGLFVFSALQNLCVRNAEKAISEKEDLASISLRLRSGFLRGIRVNDVQALWADKWLCAATRREVEDRLQFVSASRARDRLWVGSYMRVVQSEPERRRSWLSHDRSLWWWASGGTSSAPACPQKCTAPIQMWLVLVRFTRRCRPSGPPVQVWREAL